MKIDWLKYLEKNLKYLKNFNSQFGGERDETKLYVTHKVGFNAA